MVSVNRNDDGIFMGSAAKEWVYDTVYLFYEL